MVDAETPIPRVSDTLSTMERIRTRALHSRDKEFPVLVASAQVAQGAAAAPFVHEARVLLSQQNTVGPTRLRWLKRLALRMSEVFTHRLVGSTAALASGVERLEAAHEAELTQVRAELAALRQDLTVRLEQGLVPQVVSIELQVNEALDNLAHEVKGVAEFVSMSLEEHRATQAISLEEHRATHELRSASLGDSTLRLTQRLDGLEHTVGCDRSELHRVRASLARVSRQTSPSEPTEATSTPTVPAHAKAIEQQMYVDFELRFRGSRDEVLARQRDVLRFVGEFAGSQHPLVDIGCGRGEWLELLKDIGVRAYGVDTNDEMIAEVQSRGLDGIVGDAIAHLEGVAPSSLQAISGFHIAEHLSLADLGRIVDAALVALRPGGLLLLETPNPTNLAVGAAAFYLDPTHLRPLHPEFLTFLLESRGFSAVETHFVHPLREDVAPTPGGAGPGSAVERLIAAGNWALFGPQDFIVAARRHEIAV